MAAKYELNIDTYARVDPDVSTLHRGLQAAKKHCKWEKWFFPGKRTLTGHPIPNDQL